jgi:hypothetical protein
MFNPLLEDLTQLKDTDIDGKITDLTKKYNMALRSGNSGIAQQIVIILESLKHEVSMRRIEASKRLLEKQNKNLDGLINVG